ncbi:DUF167 domain-containing protein [Geobacter sp. DSM 9736]|uniref:DUF167 domain-containing protein n=1 Tax=Geobacter sp. DSM 9736 TaxID=1277350 RepID=UPI000B504B14|nr:DUF167 domain-containing protein [Geobacter sp. DSM 9736]SNB45918.1 hypothetical protein SAMN06269301_1351 [Geobacter sp. DSM 9736]
MTEDSLKISEDAEGVTFSVHVQPRASRTGICGVHDGELKIRLTSPPVDDAANRLCVEYLAKSLGIAKSSVRITAGAKSRHKTIRAEGVDSAAISALVPPIS